MGSPYIPTYRTVTIPNAASLPVEGLDMGDSRAARITIPDLWTAANLTFRVSHDGVTWNDLYDKAGTEYTVTAAAGRAIILPITDFHGIRHMKVRSGTSALPVLQTADRAIIVQVVSE